MQGKHKSIYRYVVGWIYREFTRQRLKNIVQWTPISNPEAGCTAIIGMCSRLPNVINANLRCLHESRWSALKKIIIAIDTKKIECLLGLRRE